MARWRSGTRERLQATALQRFAEHGYDETTVAEIAAAAEVTERTFYRHFADKREVLFAGQDDFTGMFTDPIAQAPGGTPALALVGRALDSAATFFPDDRRAWSRARQQVIDAVPALGERELGKLATLKVHLGGALRAHGIDEPAATIAAETAVTVFHLSFTQWIADGEDRDFATIVHERLDALTRILHPGS
ncbi:TetR/AcrR family transcriptional regulator [Curtobacterium sp. ODYSSEY 48 V2]|uniref:TetR/AcrR family transcriptional regulator n=1 Tax=Curtobacterium sp. ODYSSEY 48 V2 TaxID=2939561 RepID=UPI00203CC052|nr:TetR/AcrR family transcriptional regulator [Curtobacterium sp. ODYSSEY 48 V2]MCM3504071.1 TetR/AcrR family transcriptional regulator [Curtobacterium sp. ODYSSEY 48 V2]